MRIHSHTFEIRVKKRQLHISTPLLRVYLYKNLLAILNYFGLVIEVYKYLKIQIRSNVRKSLDLF